MLGKEKRPPRMMKRTKTERRLLPSRGREFLQTAPQSANLNQAKSVERRETLTNGKASVKVEFACPINSQQYGSTLIEKWVDYSSKYGVGYKLTNGIYGVLFNDSTKMLLAPNSFDFLYIR